MKKFRREYDFVPSLTNVRIVSAFVGEAILIRPQWYRG
jgi:hypothetical protein